MPLKKERSGSESNFFFFSLVPNSAGSCRSGFVAKHARGKAASQSKYVHGRSGAEGRAAGALRSDPFGSAPAASGESGPLLGGTQPSDPTARRLWAENAGNLTRVGFAWWESDSPRSRRASPRGASPDPGRAGLPGRSSRPGARARRSAGLDRSPGPAAAGEGPRRGAAAAAGPRRQRGQGRGRGSPGGTRRGWGRGSPRGTAGSGSAQQRGRGRWMRDAAAPELF